MKRWGLGLLVLVGLAGTALARGGTEDLHIGARLAGLAARPGAPIARWLDGPVTLPLLLAILPLLATAAGTTQAAEEPSPLPGTVPLKDPPPDLAMAMVDGIGRYLDRELAASVAGRAARWKRDFSSTAAYEASVAPNRERLRRILGAQDRRVPFADLELVATRTVPAEVGATPAYRVLAVRWPVLEGVEGEGLLLDPATPARANLVALPDCDWTPEMLAGMAPGVPAEAQFARRLAESGCRVLIPALVDRRDLWSGRPEVRFTNQPHREFLYRAAFEMGRHVIGVEVQKVLAGVDWLEQVAQPSAPVGIAGYGEGGLLALYSAALDPRIAVTLVSGYFQPRER
ncbi:MAG: hypothetical protein FJX77_08435, partial [Armatimonadetes bacterium]|nr:hypothetical protein [Armatimonadota bacterium]